MKLVYGILLAACLTSCSDYFEKDFEGINPELMPYVDAFITAASERGKHVDTSNLNMELRSIDEFGLSDNNYILIDKEFFESYEGYSDAIEVIVFHELGHSLYNLNHSDDKNSFMSSPTNITLYKAIGRDKALDNLFNLGK